MLTRSSVLVDFQLPVQDGPFRAADESLVFVAPSTAAPDYDVNLDDEELGLARIPRAPARATQSSFPGAHWLTPPPELSEEVRARAASRPDAGAAGEACEADEEDVTLPVIPLARRRGLVDAVVDACENVVGRTAAGRVVRVAVLVSIIFGSLAVHALGDARATPPPATAPPATPSPRRLEPRSELARLQPAQAAPGVPGIRRAAPGGS